MTDEITTGALAKLFDTTSKTIADLGKREIIVKGRKRGSWKRDASISGYVKHLRAEAAGRGGEAGVTARERLGAAQADLATTKAAKMRGELVEASEVETFWRGKLQAFRNRVLAVPSRLRDLTAGQNVTLTQGLRSALHELADG